jgi:aminoglycoside phosphotransferase (APT) family kinase protein
MLGIARPLLYEENSRLLWQEGIDGDTLEQRYPDDRMSPSVLRSVAGAIAALHASPVAQIPRHGPADALAELRERAKVIGYSRPQLHGSLGRVVAALTAAPPAAAPLATLHGDLHPKNVFLMGDRVCLIDLDNIQRGAAEQDLASWVACMLYRASLRRERLDSTLSAVHGFIRYYELARGASIDSQALDWYAAAALVSERAYRLLSRLKEGRLELLDDLLRLALLAADGRLLQGAPEGLTA